jgi:hypothetical protein
MPRLRDPQITPQNDTRRPHESKAGVTDYEEFGRKLLTAIHEETAFAGLIPLDQRQWGSRVRNRLLLIAGMVARAQARYCSRYHSGYRSLNQRWFAQLCSGNRPRLQYRV